MKLQCACGAKYAFEVTPDMAEKPVRFVCPTCGADSSEFVNQLIRQNLGLNPAPNPAPATRPAPVAMPQPAAPAPAPMRVQRAAPAPVAEPVAAATGLPRCPKHPSEFAEEKCVVCSKPICPKCMELFGYVCSPLCKARADSHGILVPEFAGQRSVMERRTWQRTVLVGGGIAAVALAFLGVWFWYAWFGSRPKPEFSLRFPEQVFSGQSSFYGKGNIVFLRGGTLTRYDMGRKQTLWSRYLIDTNKIHKAVVQEMKDAKDLIYRANNEAWSSVPKMPNPEKLARELERSFSAELELKIHGPNIWVVAPDKFTRFDPGTGKADKELLVKTGWGGVLTRGNEILITDANEDKQQVTRVNMDTGESRTEPMMMSPAGAGTVAVGGGRRDSLAGLPTKPGADGDKPLDPKKVAEQAQGLSLPEKLALPATLSNTRSQERTLKELDDAKRSNAAPKQPDEHITLLASPGGFVQCSVRLLEEKLVTRAAMRPKPAKSALDGEVKASQSAEVANEILNEIQRDRGGDTVTENHSRYQVKVAGPDPRDEWSGEVVGPPTVFPLETVKVVGAGKTIIVLDKANKKLWQSTLNYEVQDGLGALEEGESSYGQGPCVERNGVLYVMDEGVLTSFDLKTGNVRWRYPSVGIAGIFFDEAGMVYVNTSTASPERIRYSRQIDISARDVSVVAKLAPETGKVLWTAEPGGLVNYVSGKYLFTVATYMPPEPDEDDLVAQEEGPRVPPYLKIKRINPRNGRVIWEHFQQRSPLDIQFEKNRIRMVFKKEVQVLKFLPF